jgi:HSP20 family molecular chaperone IbpA
MAYYYYGYDYPP